MQFVPLNLAPASASEEAWCFAFVGRELIAPGGDPLRLQPLSQAALAASAEDLHYLGQLDGRDCWGLAVERAPDGWQPLALRAALAGLPAPLGAVAARAAQILEWDRTHRHCGVCGTPTTPRLQERARQCPACGHVAYPRLSPAMMALVWRPGEVLLARSPAAPPGRYSALAGFVEPGESLEDCLHREVAEEVGVRVGDLRYFGSQSWPFPHSLMVAFTARWIDGQIVPQPEEIEDARWFAIDALPDISPRLSIAGHLIRDIVAQMLRGEQP